MKYSKYVGWMGALGMVIGLFVLVPFQPVSADQFQGCHDQGGHCAYSPNVCASTEMVIPANNCQGGTCCIVAPKTCSGEGGTCRDACLPFEDQINGAKCSGILEFCCKDKLNGSVKGGVEATINKNANPTPASNAPPSLTPEQGGLVLVPCTKTGNCSLDEIVIQGVNFAKFIMGLSSALFFAVFVYGGGRYLLSFGRKSWVEAGNKAMTGAAIGMVLILGAWTIVQTLVKSIKK